jgi:ABC-type multidrug transport system fused ATPase/permease subunit
MARSGFHSERTSSRRASDPGAGAGGDTAAKSTAAKLAATPGTLIRLFPEVWPYVRPQRWLLLLGLFLMLINRGAGFVLPGSSKFIVDNIIGKHQGWLLVPLVLALLGAAAVQGITSYALTQLLSKAAQRMIADLRKQVQAQIGRLPVSFHDSSKTGALVTRIMSDVEGLRNLVGTGLIEFAGSLITGVVALVVLLRISATMTLAALSILLVFAVALNRAFGTLRPIYRARSKLNAEVTGRLTESLAGVRVVKGYRAEDREERVFAGGVGRLLENIIKTLTATSLMNTASTLLLGIETALIVYMGAKRVIAGTMTPGVLVMYGVFLGLLVAPIFQIISIGTQLTEGMAGLERTSEILSEAPEDADPKRTKSIGAIRGEVIFDQVSFAYDPGKSVLHDISFDSQPGTVTALVGPSGSGKSTIIGLIAAFYTPTSGHVLVDGIDLSQIRLEAYRTQLGIVLQETFLFDGTIRDNVSFSRPDASEADIMAACRIARVDEFAESFELKFDTIIGERGVKLSGGQRQRISIARAILADPRILILDEATSSLDSESEAMIQQGLSYLMRGRTTFVIAHRLSTIRRADQILVIEAGRIIERGNHQTLYALGGRYFDLYTKQHGLESNLFLAPGEGDSKPADGEQAGANGDAEASGESGVARAARILRGTES